jgi:hypothetical protein
VPYLVNTLRIVEVVVEMEALRKRREWFEAAGLAARWVRASDDLVGGAIE